MIYIGNEEGQSSEWMYDGHGMHGIIQWQEIKVQDEQR
jgi:hypothetical protein